MFIYQAYGLKIRSDLALPQFRSYHRDLENCVLMQESVFIHLQPDSHHKDPQSNEPTCYEISRENAVLVIKGIGTFYINKGREITIHPARRFDEQMPRVKPGVPASLRSTSSMPS